MVYTNLCLVVAHQMNDVDEEDREIRDRYGSGARSATVRENRAPPAKTRMIMRPEKYDTEATGLSV